MVYSYRIVVIELEGDHGDFRLMEARKRAYVNLLYSITLILIELGLINIGWSRLIKMKFNLYDHA